VRCDCLLSDDQDMVDIVGSRVSDIVAARVAAERDRVKILHTYWPADRPQHMKTRVVDAPSVHAALTVAQDWWKSEITSEAITRDLDGWLVQVFGWSVVTLEDGYSVRWNHLIYMLEVDDLRAAIKEARDE